MPLPFIRLDLATFGIFPFRLSRYALMAQLAFTNAEHLGAARGAGSLCCRAFILQGY